MIATESTASTMTKHAQAEWPEWNCPIHDAQMFVDGDRLECPAGHSTEISDGIPRFAPRSSYADGFGAQWNEYRITQLDSATGTHITRDRARRCLGEELWAGLDGKLVLECGCGAGRFSEILLQRGAKLTSIDLSNAIDANRINFPPGPKRRLAQASILELPFAAKQFDVVFCLGVIQHTPVPELTTARLYDQVRPGGSLVIDHYTHSLSGYTKLEFFYRQAVMRMTPAESIRATKIMVDVFLPLHRIGKISALGQAIVSRVSPVRAYYHAYPELSDAQQKEWAMLDTHDALARHYSRLRTRKQIATLLAELGAKDIWCEKGGNGVEARCRRPA